MHANASTESWRIAPIREEHVPSYRAALDAVARERRFLLMLEAPPLAAVREFVLGNLRDGNPQVVALAGETVVGWCDVLRGGMPTRRHAGTLGVGVLERWRGRGIGGSLLVSAIGLARERGFERIELAVRVDNPGARLLYERLGFEHEGRLRRHLRVDGESHDSFMMALLL
jgi:ribosomal protein S18 acetylase RimI-like enzyme